MKYNFNLLDNSNPSQPLYMLSIDPNMPELNKFELEDIRAVTLSLKLSLAFLVDARLTFDAETLLGYVWRTENRSKHNRTLGVILRKLVDLKLVPLVRVPKGSGTRIRFRIRQ